MEWLTYLLKVSACLALFYASYHFFLQRLTFFSTNRMYLISTLIISFIIPAVQLEVERPAKYSSQLNEETAGYTGDFVDLQNPAVGANPDPKAVVDAFAINWQQGLFISYWLIAVLMFGVFALQALHLLKHIRHVDKKVGGLKLIFKTEGFTNCSFLNYVFVNPKQLSQVEIAVILQHEQVHVARYHTLDKLLLSSCKAFLWFNPIIYLYDKALEQVHEYEADKETSKEIGNTPYANLLLSMAVRKNNPSLVHSFVKKPLKGRIKMLFTSQSKNMKKLAYLMVLPIGLALTWTFAVQVVYARKPPVASIQNSSTAKQIIEELPAEPVTPKKGLKVERQEFSKRNADTLRMIDDPRLGKNPEVIIDGKTYHASILTEISPRCVQSTKIYIGKVEITTVNNEIEYANKIDRENVLTRNKANALKKFYVRYSLKNQDGSRYDVVKVNNTGGSVSLSLSKGDKILLIIDGKHYSEQEAKKLTAEQFSELTGALATSIISPALQAKYGNRYKAFIEISKPGHFSGEEKIPSRDADDIEANNKVSYSAQDSILVNDKEGSLELFGEVSITKGKLNITADKAKFELASQIVYAKGVSFTNKLHHNPITAGFVKFSLKEGTYQILQNIPDF